MPIRIDSGGEETPLIKPGTNAHELLTVLLDHPDMGFSPKELADLTDVPHSSVHKTLSRLQEKGLVRKIDSYWAVTDDVAASRIANFVSLQQIETEYGDDAYGGEDEWTDDVPDLGENA
ncbi:MAG: MarR family transcriptional regulator [Halobacteriaceae archaeon]